MTVGVLFLSLNALTLSVEVMTASMLFQFL